MEKTPTIISDTARLTSRKFIGVFRMALSFSTTRQTSELPSKLMTTMTEHRDITTMETGMLATDSGLYTIAAAGRNISCWRKTLQRYLTS